MQEQQGSGLAVSKETPCSLNTLKINGISLDLSPQVLAAWQSWANVSSTSPSTFPPEVFSQLQMQLQSLAFSENASANPTSRRVPLWIPAHCIALTLRRRRSRVTLTSQFPIPLQISLCQKHQGCPAKPRHHRVRESLD